LLLGAALRIFADSILAYDGRKEREGLIRFYPPVILTLWSGFETFVREKSELFVIVGRDVPVEVRNCLLDQETYLDNRSDIKTRDKHRNVLERYRVLLKFAYGFEVDRGDAYWQQVEAAQELRDYYPPLDVRDARAITSANLVDYMEAVLMVIIHPSAKLKKTLLLGIYGIYNLWSALADLAKPFVEKPPLMDMRMNDGFLFHCNFENVDEVRFPAA